MVLTMSSIHTAVISVGEGLLRKQIWNHTCGFTPVSGTKCRKKYETASRSSLIFEMSLCANLQLKLLKPDHKILLFPEFPKCVLPGLFWLSKLPVIFFNVR